MSQQETVGPPLREVVSIEVAEAELRAVRDLLAQLEREVSTEQQAAADAERRSRAVGSSLDADLDAVERSRRIVEEMTVARHTTWRSSYEEARLAAEARLAEASRLAAELAAASSRHVSEILADHLPEATAPVAPLAAWAAPTAPHPPVPAPPVELPAPALIAQAADTNEAFWREEAAATAARSTASKAVASFAPIEAILPTIALVIVLIAVLLLVG